jgi:hypothetical protein
MTSGSSGMQSSRSPARRCGTRPSRAFRATAFMLAHPNTLFTPAMLARAAEINAELEN